VTDSSSAPTEVILPEGGDVVSVPLNELNPDDQKVVMALLLDAAVGNCDAVSPEVSEALAVELGAIVLKHEAKALAGPALEAAGPAVDARIESILGQKTWKKLEAEVSKFNQMVADGKVPTKDDLSSAISPEALGGVVREYLLSMEVSEDHEVEAMAKGLEAVIREAMTADMASAIERAAKVAREEAAPKRATTPWGQVALDYSRISGRAAFDPVNTVAKAVAFGLLYKLVAGKISRLPNSRAVVVTVGAGLSVTTETVKAGSRWYRGRKDKPADEAE